MTAPSDLPRMPAASVRAVLDGLAACDVSRTALMAAAGLDGEALEAPEALVGVEALFAVWAAAQAIEPRATLPLEAGLRAPYGAFGALDYLAGTAATVGGAVQSLAEHLAITSPAFGLAREGARVTIRWKPPVPPWITSDLFTLGVLLGRFAALAVTTAGVAIEVAGVAPGDVAAFERLVGGPVRFEAEVSALLYAPATYDAKLRSADVRLHDTLRALARTLHVDDAPSELEQAVRARLRSLLPSSEVEVGVVARSLGMSVRTLQRRLAEIDRTFVAVVEDFRRDEALRLVETTRMPFVTIAHALGFAEQSSFNRAFRRWTGRTPRDARTAALPREGKR